VSGRKLLQSMSGLTLVVSLLAGCGGAQAVPTATPVPPTALPTPTPAPPTTTPLPPPSATPEVVLWDYVVLGDSLTLGFGKKYANFIEADLGVEIKVHSRNRGGQDSRHLLDELRNNEELRNEIREAEIVTFNISPLHFKVIESAYMLGECGGPDNQDCLREALALLKSDTDALIAEILSLRSTSDTIIRAMTCPIPYVNWYKEKALFEGVYPYWAAYNAYVVQAASEHNIPVARVYHTFNGPNGDEDSEDKGYTGSDGVHPSPVGDDLIAELFRELGYEPLAP
jgi:hypothetical protein